MSTLRTGKKRGRARRLWIALAFVCAISMPITAQDTSMQSKESQAVARAAAPTEMTAAPKPLPGPVSDESFIVGPDDVLAISVWKEPDVSRVVPVRSDGKISLPLVGELQASGQTPRQLEREIAGKLQSFISEPEVTVIVQEAKQRFNILGQVARPGSYLLTNTSTVLDAIAMAGGFRDFAKKKSIYVLRQNPDGTQSRLGFNYKDVIQGKNSDQNIRLKPRDTVVIP